MDSTTCTQIHDRVQRTLVSAARERDLEVLADWPSPGPSALNETANIYLSGLCKSQRADATHRDRNTNHQCHGPGSRMWFQRVEKSRRLWFDRRFRFRNWTCRRSGDSGARWHILVDEAERTDHCAVADGDAHRNHTPRADEYTVADPRRTVDKGLGPQAGRPRDAVVRVDLDSRGYRDVVADNEATDTIKHHVGADPRSPAYLHVTQDQHIVITGRTLPETVEGSRLPPVREQVTHGDVAIELRVLLLT